MGSRASLMLRIPLILLALVDLALLALRLWPWAEIRNLPNQGTTGYDPLICLLAYIGLLYLVGGNRSQGVQKALVAGTLFGIPAGLFLVGYSLIGPQSVKSVFYTQIALLAVAAILWGIGGMRGGRIAGNPSIGIVAGIWGAMVSGLIGCAVVLARINLQNPQPLTTDPWKQYQGLAIGNEAIQVLVHSLNMATAFLLISPLVGGALGLIFALATQGD